MIPVTKPFLPPYEEYQQYLTGIWERNWLTNNGPLLVKLEEDLKHYLGVKHVFVVNNGTIAIQIAIKALNWKGEIITTPFSYVATTSSIVWEQCTPRFADIEATSKTIDPRAVEALINEKTSGILATHVYGNPCDVEALQKIADKHGIQVVYDAAHAFAAGFKGTSVLNYGDISTLSFHATKLFHTIEGGAIVTNNDDLAARISYMRNFGHKGPTEFVGCGINAKTSEFNAAMGLCILPKVKDLIAKRKAVFEKYNELLKNTPLVSLEVRNGTEYNYAYYPLVFPDETKLLQVVAALEAKEVVTRRYFYPSLNNLNYVAYEPCPISEDICRRVLCLPFFPELTVAEQEMIASVVIDQF